MLFEVCGLDNRIASVSKFVAQTFAVLTRGAPTHPSPQLQSLLKFNWSDMPKDPLALVSHRLAVWDKTVAGASDGYNPALEFLDHIVPNHLGEWAFIRQLIVPEFPLFRSLGAPGNLLGTSNEERVDFFLPQADLVIEIDGSQHLAHQQIKKDEARDRFLKRFGISTLRLKTSDLQSKNSSFASFLEKIREQCEASSRLKPYKTRLKGGKETDRSIRLELTAVIRLQIAILLAVSRGQLSTSQREWCLNVRQDFHSDENSNWVETAIQELFDWLELFARLNNANFQAPSVRRGEEGLLIDMRLFSRHDDEIERGPGIRVCTSPVQDLPIEKGLSSDWHEERLRDYGVSFLRTEDADKAEALPKTTYLSELTRRVFGHESFRPGQETLILNAISGQKSLGLMPTGGGKSLCFQVPAQLETGTTIVVVPIKALGRDHCAELEAVGFKNRVVNIDSDMPASLRDGHFYDRIIRGELRFVFVSPERFQSEPFREIVKKLREKEQLSMFVIDEVHCLSEWGHDFRPSYLTLPGTLKGLGDSVPVLGLTATASVNVLRDIQNEFQIPDELVAYEMHRGREELNFSIRNVLSTPPSVVKEVDKIIENADGDGTPAIHVFARYVNGPSGVEAFATALEKLKPDLRVGIFSGVEPKMFDADVAYRRLQNPKIVPTKKYESYKQTVQTLWKSGQLDVIATTKAFGMGVNKPDVRHTLHAGMPSSMEAFYQEAGRAGRDGKPSVCHMLFRPEQDDAEKLFLNLANNLEPDKIDAVLQSAKGGQRGDFRAQLWFLRQGMISLGDELALVQRLHGLLQNSPEAVLNISSKEIEYSGPSQGLRFQLTLYRLYQVGLIAPWSITDWGRRDGTLVVEVEKLPISFSQACDTFAVRVQAVVGKGTHNDTFDQLNALRSSALENWAALFRIMLQWVRRTQLDARLQSTWNLYEKSQDFSPERATEFREELEAFFKVDNDAFQLAALRDMPLSEAANSLTEMITIRGSNSVKEEAALRLLYAQLSRLLEGTQESAGLNLAASCLQLMTEKKDSAQAEARFRAAVPNGIMNFWNGSGRELLVTVASSTSLATETIGEWLVRENLSRQQLVDIYKEIPAIAVESVLFKEMAVELENAI